LSLPLVLVDNGKGRLDVDAVERDKDARGHAKDDAEPRKVDLAVRANDKSEEDDGARNDGIVGRGLVEDRVGEDDVEDDGEGSRNLRTTCCLVRFLSLIFWGGAFITW